MIDKEESAALLLEVAHPPRLLHRIHPYPAHLHVLHYLLQLLVTQTSDIVSKTVNELHTESRLLSHSPYALTLGHRIGAVSPFLGTQPTTQ